MRQSDYSPFSASAAKSEDYDRLSLTSADGPAAQ
jgi:hypothetical protein